MEDLDNKFNALSGNQKSLKEIIFSCEEWVTRDFMNQQRR